MIVFAAVAFVNAFLLFQVQLVVGKFILPWFGGVPAVWTTSMMFFQVLLLLGYAWSRLASGEGRRAKLGFSVPVLAALSMGLLVLRYVRGEAPILPPPVYKPRGAGTPVLSIVAMRLKNSAAPQIPMAFACPPATLVPPRTTTAMDSSR